MSFNAVLDALKTLFETDSGLLAFVAAKGWDPLTVKTTIKHRESVALDELPIVMLSRPRVKRDREYGSLNGSHTVRIYAGFYQPAAALRVPELIEFEELLVAAIEKNPDLGELVEGINPGESMNDEGVIETCFLVQEIEVIKQGV